MLLITGASGVGKSTVRTIVARELSPEVECVELLDLTPPPDAMTQAWRQRAAELDAIAVCLLDASPEAQAERLAARGDDPTLLIHHQAFAEWMRRQAIDPLHMTHVVSHGGWEDMR